MLCLVPRNFLVLGVSKLGTCTLQVASLVQPAMDYLISGYG